MKKLVLMLLIMTSCNLFAQTYNVFFFDVDYSQYPKISAKFYIFDDEGNQIDDFSEADFNIIENGIQRDVLNLSCPDKEPTDELSIAMSIDVSGSMAGSLFGDVPVELGKQTARELIHIMKLPPSEFALQQCESFAMIIQDFTTDKELLLKKIDPIYAYGGNNFTEHLLNSYTGLMNVAKEGKFDKKAAVIYTDAYWQKLQDHELDRCIEICKEYNIKFFSVIYSRPEAKPDGIKASLKEISEKSGGAFYDGIVSSKAAEEIAMSLATMIKDFEPCTIEWISDGCEINRKVEISIPKFEHNDFLEFNLNYSILPLISITPSLSISFGGIEPGTKSTKEVTITAESKIIDVDEITLSEDEFSIIDYGGSNPPFSIAPNESRTFTIEFSPIDSSQKICEIEIISNACFGNLIYCSGGFLNYKKNLTLIHPNGGEIFVGGSDTIITWKGLLPSEKVSLDFSPDNGATWENIYEYVDGLEQKWQNIPLIESDKCLMKVYTGGGGSNGAPEIQWQRSFGGAMDDKAVSVIPTLDNGYILCGQSNSSNGDLTNNKGGKDAWIIKTDGFGIIEWQKNYGGSQEDRAVQIVQTNDSNFVVLGDTGSNDGDVRENRGYFDMWAFKIDPVGNMIWSKVFGNNLIQFGSSIQQTYDNGFIIGGISTDFKNDFNFSVIKIDNAGNIEWEKTIGGSSSDQLYSVCNTKDNGYLIAGFTKSEDMGVKNEGLNDIYITKLDYLGNVDWQKSFGGTRVENATAIIETSDLNIIVAGYSESNDGDFTNNNGNNDFCVLKLDNDGNLIWQKTYGGSKNEFAFDVIETDDRNYLICGSSSSESDQGDITETKGGIDSWFVKIDQNGELIWQKNYGGTNNDTFNSLNQSPDGGYIVTGYSNSNDLDLSNNNGDDDVWLVKFYPDQEALEDRSDDVFSIVIPEASSFNVDMGEVIVNDRKDSLVIDHVYNTGSYKIRIDSIYISGIDPMEFDVSTTSYPFYLEPGEGKSIEFSFFPNSIGNKKADINIITQADTLIQNIIGIGVERKIKVLNDFIDFGIIEIYDRKDTTMFLLKNVSTESIEITSAKIIGPDSLQFEIINGGDTFILAPNEERELSLSFKPIYNGRTSGRIAFEFNEIGSPAISYLFGTGIGGDIFGSIDSAYAGEILPMQIFLDVPDINKFSEVIHSCSGIVRFENSILTPLDRDNIIKVQNDSIYVSFENEIDPNNGLIGSIETIAGLGRVEKTSIDILEVKWYDEDGYEVTYDSEITNGMFTLLGICEEGGTRLINPTGQAGIINVTPNPAENTIDLEVSLIEKGKTEIAIYNIMGEKVAEILNNSIENSGTYTYNTDITGLSTGQYYIVLQTPTIRETKQIMILK